MLEGYIDLTEAQGYISSGVLLNTTAVIDRDYAYADNEGHIFLAIKNTSNETMFIDENEKIDDGCTGQFHSGPFRVWCDEHSNQEA